MNITKVPCTTTTFREKSNIEWKIISVLTFLTLRFATNDIANNLDNLKPLKRQGHDISMFELIFTCYPAGNSHVQI